MHLNNNDLIISRAERLVKTHGTRDASSLARALDITIMERNFTTQKGAYISQIAISNFEGKYIEELQTKWEIVPQFIQV